VKRDRHPTEQPLRGASEPDKTNLIPIRMGRDGRREKKLMGLVLTVRAHTRKENGKIKKAGGDRKENKGQSANNKKVNNSLF